MCLPAWHARGTIDLPEGARARSHRGARGNAPLPAGGRGQQGGGADERARVPLLGLAQRGGEGAQDAARALEACELRPAAVEHLGEIGMEGEARAEAFLRGRLLPGRRVVEPCEAPHHPDHVRPEDARVPDILRLEETPAQHLRHVLLLYRLHPFLALAPEHVEEPGDQLGAQRAPLLAGVGGQQRGHHRRPVHLGHGLGQVLEEILDAVAPYRIEPRLLAGVHQYFVHQDERREPLLLRHFEELHQEGLGRWRLALLVPAPSVDRAQPFRARELEGQHAPGVAERARPAPRARARPRCPVPRRSCRSRAWRRTRAAGRRRCARGTPAPRAGRATPPGPGTGGRA